MEFFAAREIGNAAREAAAVADAGDFFAAARGGLCGPLRTADHAAAARRLSGAGGSVHLHGVCAGCGARLPAAVAAELVPLRADSGHYVLFSRAAGCGGAPDPERASKIEIL